MIKPNLAIFIYSLSGGGAERIVSDLCSELCCIYNITLVLMNDNVDYEIIGADRIVYLEKSLATENGLFKFLKLPLLAWKYKNILKQYNIDISLSLLTRPNYISILSQLWMKKRKIVISEHSFLSKMYEGNTFQSKINRLLIPILYSKSSEIIAISRLIALDLENNFKINKNKIHIIYNPFNLERIYQKSLASIDFDFSKYTFVTVGRLDNGKNHKLQIEAFQKLEDKNTQLLILGEGRNKEFLEKLVINLELKDRVFLLGFDANPYKYMRQSACFILSSNFEGLPTVIIEAMACGIPVISTDCKSGPREILAPQSDITTQLENEIELAEYGILTPVDNIECMKKAMDIAIRDTSRMELYKSKTVSRANDFSKEKSIKKYIELLTS